MHLSEFLQARHNKRTAQDYYKLISHYMGNQPHPEQSTYTEVLNYLGKMRDTGKSSTQIKRMLFAIKNYYRYLCHQGIRKDNPAQNIHLKDKTKSAVQLQNLISSEQLNSLFHHICGINKQTELRNKVMISLFIYQAITIQEAANLCVQDIDLDKLHIYIAPSYGNSRILPINAQQVILLHDYINKVRKELLGGLASEKLLISWKHKPMTADVIRQYISRHYNIIAGKSVNAKIIRQSVLNILLKQQKDIRIVQSFAGHKWICSTQKYQSSNESNLQLALNLYHPINKA